MKNHLPLFCILDIEVFYWYESAVQTLAIIFRVLSEHILVPFRIAKYGILPLNGKINTSLILLPSHKPSNIIYTQLHQFLRLVVQHNALISENQPHQYPFELHFVGQNRRSNIFRTVSMKNWALCKLIKLSNIFLRNKDMRISKQQYLVAMTLVQDTCNSFYHNEVPVHPHFHAKDAQIHTQIARHIVGNKLLKEILRWCRVTVKVNRNMFFADKANIKFNIETLYHDLLALINSSENSRKKGEYIKLVRYCKTTFWKHKANPLLAYEVLEKGCELTNFILEKSATENYRNFYVRNVLNKYLDIKKEHHKLVEYSHKGSMDDTALYHLTKVHTKHAIMLSKHCAYFWRIFVPGQNYSQVEYLSESADPPTSWFPSEFMTKMKKTTGCQKKYPDLSAIFKSKVDDLRELHKHCSIV